MENRFVISINRNVIFYFLVIFPFFPFDYFSYFIPILNTFCTYARVLVVLILLLRLIIYEKTISVPFIIALLFFGATIISSYLSNIDLTRSLNYGICILGVSLIVQDGLFFDCDSFIQGALLFFEILVYANLLYYILNPNGFFSPGHRVAYYLLGNYNTVIRKVFPGLVIGALYAFRTKGRLTVRFFMMSAAVFIFLIMNYALTATIGFLIFIIGLIIYSILGRNPLFKYEYFLIISIIITIVFVIIGNFSAFETLITDIFGKNMTLSSRTQIWSRALAAIPKKLVWGYGLGGSSYMRSIIQAVAAHNIYLDILLFSGIIGMIILGFTLFIVWRKIKNCRGSNSAAPVIFDCAFCAIFIMWNFEPFGSLDELYKIFMIFTMAYYCRQFTEYCSTRFKKQKGRAIERSDF